MRALKAAVIVMGLLIVAGVATLATLLAQRVMVPAGSSIAATSVLDEPAGTRIAGLSALPDRVALLLQGGGPDRVVLVDPRNGRVVGRVALSR